jgi:hypothetical protein
MRRQWLMAGAACVGGLAAWSAPARAGLLLNQDFESHPNPDASTTTFANWTETAGTVAVLANVSLGGTASARLVAGTGTMSQSIVSPVTVFRFDLDFAAVIPAADATTRTMNVLLQQSGAGNQINLRVVRPVGGTTGDVQVFNGTAFQTILTGAVNFSGADLSVPVTNHLVLAGDLSSATPANRTYTVTVNGSSSPSEALFQTGIPTNVGAVQFATNNGTNTDYEVDNAVLIPEPGSLGVLAAAALGLLARRSRSCWA